MPAARNALVRLRKLQAASQVGVNKVNYSPLLIEAQASVNDADRLLAEKNLKTELNEAIRAYADAGALWDVSGLIDSRQEPGASIKVKYHLAEETLVEGRYFLDKDKSIRIIWLFADAHIENAGKLISEK